MVFKRFKSRQEWLQARQDSIGASTLAYHMVHKTLPDPVDEQNSTVMLAIYFGSMWEHYIAKKVAKQLGLEEIETNKPIELLLEGEFAWHDNSFYLNENIHASLDACFKKNEKTTIVEIKTGSARTFAELNSQQKETYIRQMLIEKTISGAKDYVLAYVNRPAGWDLMNVEAIKQHIDQHLEILDNTAFPNVQEYTVEELQDYVRQLNTGTDLPVAGEPTIQDYAEKLLEQYKLAENIYKEKKKELEEFMFAHPDLKVTACGFDCIVKQSVTNRTDYKGLFAKYEVPSNVIQEFQTQTVRNIVSVTQHKE